MGDPIHGTSNTYTQHIGTEQYKKIHTIVISLLSFSYLWHAVNKKTGMQAASLHTFNCGKHHVTILLMMLPVPHINSHGHRKCLTLSVSSSVMYFLNVTSVTQNALFCKSTGELNTDTVLGFVHSSTMSGVIGQKAGKKTAE